MKVWLSLMLVMLAACGGDDDITDGTRGLCAEGGALNDCEDIPRTPWDACWRMVDCGALPLHQEDGNRDDFDNCLTEIERMRDIGQQLTIACIATSTCDQLRLNDDRCFLFGAN